MIHSSHKPYPVHGEDRDEPEPGALPIEPDDGHLQPGMPTAPDHDGAPDAPEV